MTAKPPRSTRPKARTEREHIVALPSGSRPVSLFKGYTAASRHEYAAWIVVNEADERKDIARRIPLWRTAAHQGRGHMANVAENLSRTPEKATAIDMLSRATDIRRGGLRRLQVGGERQERMQARGISQAQVRGMQQSRRVGLSQTVEALAERARELPRMVVQHARELSQNLRQQRPFRER